MSAPTADANDPATLTGHIIGSELRVGDVLGNRFRIDALLGIGGMGVVYRAHDLSLGIDVAIKLLRPELARRPEAFASFRQELLLARQVSSPHVVRIHDIAEHDGRWFISMDFIAGDSLERKCGQAQRLPTAEALAITRGLLEGLSAAHQRGVVHRDLKPANVLIDESGHAYITDFGIARSLGATGLTQTGVIVGTPEYLSPEQARGLGVDARSDLYAVGLILYEMLTGDLPFAGGTPAEIVIQRILREPPSLARARPDLPRWLHAFSDRLLKVNPAHRFASAKDALRALDTQRVPRPPLSRRMLAAAALVVLALTAGAWTWRQHPTVISRLFAPAVVATPRIALLPLRAPADDAELGALARALDDHLRAWLRGDPRIAVVLRRRVVDALARVAPDAQEDALRRQLADVAQAANATRLWRGQLRRAKPDQLELALTEPGATTAKTVLSVHAATPAELFAAYLNAMPAVLAAQNLRAGRAPDLAADAVLPLGRALLATDADHANAAAAELAATTAASALVLEARLDAQEADHQSLPAQNTREAIIARFAHDPSPDGRELYARALADHDEGPKALQVLADATRDFPNDARLALLDAETLGANGKGAEAMDVLKQAVKRDDQDARAWFLLGRRSILQGEPRPAVDDYLVRALVLYTRAGNAPGEAETRNAMGIGYERLGQLDAAAEQYTRAVAMREQLGDKFGLSKSLRNLAIVQAVRGDRDLAEKTLDRAKTLLEELGDQASLADLYNDRGVVAEERGDFATAQDAYRKALVLRQRLDVPDLVAESLDNVGFSSYQLGRFDDALVYWQQALAMYKTLDDRGRMLHVEQSMGLLDTARGHFAAARERLESTLSAAQDSQLSGQAAAGHVDLAELGLVEGRYAEALMHAQRARQIFTRRSDQRGETEAGLLEARVAVALGDTGQAEAALKQIPGERVGAEQRAALLLAQARVAGLRNDPRAATADLERAAAAAAEAHSGALDMQIRLEQARLALAEGRRADAARVLTALAAETSRLNEVPLRLQWLELEIAAALGAEDRRLAVSQYRQALAMLKDVGDYAHADAIHELGARALPAGAEADAALAAAKAARTRLLASAPADARERFGAALERRLHDELPRAAAR